jgi:hypothetical protein
MHVGNLKRKFLRERLCFIITRLSYSNVNHPRTKLALATPERLDFSGLPLGIIPVSQLGLKRQLLTQNILIILGFLNLLSNL